MQKVESLNFFRKFQKGAKRRTKFQKVVKLYSDKAKGHALFFTRSSW